MLPVPKIGAVVVIVLVVAVAFVLVTPDPTDDVDAILGPGKGVQLQALAAVSALTSLLITPAAQRSQIDAAPHVAPALLELLCSSRC